MTNQQLATELHDLQLVWSAVWRRLAQFPTEPSTGKEYPDLRRAEVDRFVDRPELLVARHDFVQLVALSRGMEVHDHGLAVVLPNGKAIRGAAERQFVVEEYNTWEVFAYAVGWPTGDENKVES
jgi:hypothetical protein